MANVVEEFKRDIMFKSGGRFTPRKSLLVKNAEKLNSKRDMRKKFIKSNSPTYKTSRVKKGANGMPMFTSYESINPQLEEFRIDNPFKDLGFISKSVSEKSTKTTPVQKEATELKKEDKMEAPVFRGNQVIPIKKVYHSMTGDKKEFINTMRPLFSKSLQDLGLDTKYADYLVAQSALESGWGKSQSGKFNLGGIKGKGTVRKTREVINGKDIYINDSFRDFQDLQDYANYHVGLLNNKRYNAFNGGDFSSNVANGGYATDPKYKATLDKMYEQVSKT